MKRVVEMILSQRWAPLLSQSLEFSSDSTFAFGFRLNCFNKINKKLWDKKNFYGPHVCNSADVKIPF